MARFRSRTNSRWLSFGTSEASEEAGQKPSGSGFGLLMEVVLARTRKGKQKSVLSERTESQRSSSSRRAGPSLALTIETMRTIRGRNGRQVLARHARRVTPLRGNRKFV